MARKYFTPSYPILNMIIKIHVKIYRNQTNPMSACNISFFNFVNRLVLRKSFPSVTNTLNICYGETFDLLQPRTSNFIISSKKSNH
jgi:hypothetical protein